MASDQRIPRKKIKNPQIIIAIIGAIAAIVAAIFASPWIIELIRNENNTNPPSVSNTGRLEGTLTDRDRNPIKNITVSIPTGPKTRTDMQGVFILNDVPVGDQVIVIEPPSGKGQLAQNIKVEKGMTTKINIVYDPRTTVIGLLSITSPPDDSRIEVRRSDVRVKIYGHCDGLAQVFNNNFEVWILVRSDKDGRYWVQHPSALVDLIQNTWRASAYLGDAQHPPSDGDRWDLMAVAANSGSEIRRITNVMSLDDLPPHIRSNVVSFETLVR